MRGPEARGLPCLSAQLAERPRGGPARSGTGTVAEHGANVHRAPATETPAGRVADVGANGAGRLRSVDAVRGLAILGMLAVNWAGAAAERWPQLAHVPWHGLRAADVVFPVFLVVVGVGMGLAPARRRAWAPLVRRAAILFAVGVVLNLVPEGDLGTVRIMGILQRIALAAVLASAVLRLRRPAQVAAGVALLAGHWALLALVPAPAPVPGVALRTGTYAAVPGWVDARVLGPAHGYEGTVPDPEGLLGTLPSAVTVLIGAWAAAPLRGTDGGGADGQSAWRRRAGTAAPVALAGVVAVAAGAGWSALLPLNKTLWTGSFTVTTAGIALLVLAGARVLLDGGGVGGALGDAFGVLGRNALVVYVLGEVVRRSFRGTAAGATAERWSTAVAGGEVGGALLLLGSVVAACWAVAAVLHRRGWYVTV